MSGIHETPIPASVLDPAPTPADTTPPRPPRPVSQRTEVPFGATQLRSLAAQGTPIFSAAPDGHAQGTCTATWVRFDDDGAEPVRLVANKLVDLMDPYDGILTPLPEDPTVAACSYVVPRDWRCSYLFTPAGGGGGFADPLNPRTVASKWAVGDMSLAQGPDAHELDGWRRPDGSEARPVQAIRFRSDALGNERTVWRGSTVQGPSPRRDILVLLDGEVWATVLPVMALLDNLVERGAIPAHEVIMIESLGPAMREIEMAGNPRFVEAVAQLVAEAANELGRSVEEPTTTIVGQSLGGLTAGFALLTRPEVFSAALCQSPSLWWPNRPGAQGWLTDAFERSSASERQRMGVQVGTDEWVLLEPTRRLRAVLDAGAPTGSTPSLVHYREFSGGHDHACWQAELADGLVAVLGGA